MGFDVHPDRDRVYGALRSIERDHRLSAEQEVELSNLWRKHGNLEARNRLILSQMRLANSISFSFSKYGLSRDDIAQAAIIGLFKAVDKFDPTVGTRFSTYAVWWMKHSVRIYIVENTGAGEKKRALVKRYFFSIRKIVRAAEMEILEQGERPDGAKIAQIVAEKISLPVHKAEALLHEITRSSVHLDAPQSVMDEGDDRSLIDSLACKDPTPEEAVENSDTDQFREKTVAQALSALSERERDIIMRRRMNDDAETLYQIGQSIGVSAERVRQLEEKALNKMQNTLRRLRVKKDDLGI